MTTAAKVLITIICISRGSVGIFLNPLDVLHVFLTEHDIAQGLQELHNLHSNEAVKSFLRDRRDVLREINEEPHLPIETRFFDRVVANPIHVYKLVVRAQSYKEKVLTYLIQMKEPEGKYNLSKIIDLFEKESWSTEDDVNIAILGIVRPQFTYSLRPVDIASGKLGKRQTFARLTTNDCMHIAKNRLSGENPVSTFTGPEYAQAISWISAAIEVARFEFDSEEKIADLKLLLDRIKMIHDEKFDEAQKSNLLTKIIPNEAFFMRKFSDAKPGEIVTPELLRDEEVQESAKKLRKLSLEYLANLRDFEAVCRGEKLNFTDSNYLVPGKICILEDYNDPYLKLAPAKIEIVMSNPALYMVHDVLTNQEIAQFKEKSSHMLSRSGLYDVKSPDQTKYSLERTQSHSWLWDRDNEWLRKISFRFEHLTRLSLVNSDFENQYGDVVASEAWQVGVYSPGGMYLPHHDYFPSEDLEKYWRPNGFWIGNRIATAMIYLSDVDGGATGFPLLGTAVFPKKGSFAFWYNLHRNGSSNIFSLHGACPTTFGIKWVSNKWIHEGSQFQKYPCDPRQNY